VTAWPSPTPSEARKRSDATDWLFWAAVWLAVVLVAVKAYYLATRTDPALVDLGLDLSSLTAISYRDVAFAFVAWAIARAAMLLAVRRAGAEWTIVVLFMIGAALSCLYAIASVVAFGILGGFLTWALLQLVGNLRMLSSSVSAYLTRGVAAGLIGVPLAYGGLVWATTRIPVLSRLPRPYRAAAALMLVVFWAALGHWIYVTQWATHYDWRIADNAPWVLASSWWRAVRGEQTVRISDQFPAADLADFEPAGQRQVAPPIVPPRRRRSTPARLVRPGRPPNVILVILESVGLRWTSFGGRYDTTPTLKSESSRAVVFDNAYAHVGRSSNSLASILLSVYPKLNFRDFTQEYPLVQRTSLAALFRDRGYRTAFMTSSDLSWAGWDVFLPSRGFIDVRDDHALACSAEVSSWGVEDRCLVDGLIDYMSRDPTRPFFAMGWTQQTHHPYEPSPGVPLLDLLQSREPVPDDYDLQRYLNVLHETDRQLARLFDAVRRAGLADDTIIAVLGDHGQAFGYPHDSYLQGRTAYEEDVHVPMMIWWPRRYQSETHVPTVGGHVDVALTIAELAGVPPAPDWQGRSLLDPTHPPRAYFYVAQDEFKLGVRENEWKYIYDLRTGTDELYDVVVDPDERQRVRTESARAARLRQRLAAWAESNRRQYERLPSK
jgi:phosphoglycerol transferase MdoB-like AlkP superfamily enzyme